MFYNLNALNYDIVFIKNIDNVLPRRKLEQTILYKKLLAAYLMNVQTQIYCPA